MKLQTTRLARQSAVPVRPSQPEPQKLRFSGSLQQYRLSDATPIPGIYDPWRGSREFPIYLHNLVKDMPEVGSSDRPPSLVSIIPNCLPFKERQPLLVELGFQNEVEGRMHWVPLSLKIPKHRPALMSLVNEAPFTTKQKLDYLDRIENACEALTASTQKSTRMGQKGPWEVRGWASWPQMPSHFFYTNPSASNQRVIFKLFTLWNRPKGDSSPLSGQLDIGISSCRGFDRVNQTLRYSPSLVLDPNRLDRPQAVQNYQLAKQVLDQVIQNGPAQYPAYDAFGKPADYRFQDLCLAWKNLLLSRAPFLNP